MPKIINIADLVNPESGLSFRQENNALTHAIPILTLVEITMNPEYPSIHDGLRLFVHSQNRDCDGTPLYMLTANYETVGHDLDPRNAKTETERWKSTIFRGATIHGFAEASLTVIKTAEEVAIDLRHAGYGLVDGRVQWVE